MNYTAKNLELAPPPSEYLARIIHAMCAITQTSERGPFILLSQVLEKLGCKWFWDELPAPLTQANEIFRH